MLLLVAVQKRCTVWCLYGLQLCACLGSVDLFFAAAAAVWPGALAMARGASLRASRRFCHCSAYWCWLCWGTLPKCAGPAAAGV
jgi:hypothetical protein